MECSSHPTLPLIGSNTNVTVLACTSWLLVAVPYGNALLSPPLCFSGVTPTHSGGEDRRGETTNLVKLI